MHPMFIELFIETDADDLAEQDRRRRVRRSRRARPSWLSAAAGGHDLAKGHRSEIRPSDRNKATYQPPTSSIRHCGNFLPAWPAQS